MTKQEREAIRVARVLGQLAGRHHAAWDHAVKRRKMSLTMVPYHVLYNLVCYFSWHGFKLEQIRDIVSELWNAVAQSKGMEYIDQIASKKNANPQRIKRNAS